MLKLIIFNMNNNSLRFDAQRTVNGLLFVRFTLRVCVCVSVCV